MGIGWLWWRFLRTCSRRYWSLVGQNGAYFVSPLPESWSRMSWNALPFFSGPFSSFSAWLPIYVFLVSNGFRRALNVLWTVGAKVKWKFAESLDAAVWEDKVHHMMFDPKKTSSHENNSGSSFLRDEPGTTRQHNKLLRSTGRWTSRPPNAKACGVGIARNCPDLRQIIDSTDNSLRKFGREVTEFLWAI